jgi:hypothetical protein
MEINNRKPYDHTIHLRMSSSLFEKIKSLAIREERSVSGMIKYILTQFLNNKLQIQ